MTPGGSGPQSFSEYISWRGVSLFNATLCSNVQIGSVGNCRQNGALPILIGIFWIIPLLGCSAFLILAWIAKTNMDRAHHLEERKVEIEHGWVSPTMSPRSPTHGGGQLFPEKSPSRGSSPVSAEEEARRMFSAVGENDAECDEEGPPPVLEHTFAGPEAADIAASAITKRSEAPSSAVSANPVNDIPDETLPPTRLEHTLLALHERDAASDRTTVHHSSTLPQCVL